MTRRLWTRNQIIALIRNRVAAGLLVASYDVMPRSAPLGADRVSGSWKAALEAVGGIAVRDPAFQDLLLARC